MGCRGAGQPSARTSKAKAKARSKVGHRQHYEGVLCWACATATCPSYDDARATHMLWLLDRLVRPVWDGVRAIINTLVSPFGLGIRTLPRDWRRPPQRATAAAAASGAGGRRRERGRQTLQDLAMARQRSGELSSLLDHEEGEEEEGEGSAEEAVVGRQPGPGRRGAADDGWHGGQAAAGAVAAVSAGACVECEGPAAVHCVQCADSYCPVCFAALHRKGRRAQHTVTALDGGGDGGGGCGAPRRLDAGAIGMVSTDELYTPAWFVQRARYIPVRLSMDERRALRLLQSALGVFDYTDRVAAAGGGGAALARHMSARLRDVCGLLSGAVTAVDYEKGRELTQERDFEKYRLRKCKYRDGS
eukprot:COSAG01_NODE_7517_length_3170_cov_1.655161_3_plen_360_part_00